MGKEMEQVEREPGDKQEMGDKEMKEEGREKDVEEMGWRRT